MPSDGFVSCPPIPSRATGWLSRAGTLGVCALVLACKAPPAPSAQIIDLSTSLDELRRDFDAHQGEARFVTLLAPT